MSRDADHYLLDRDDYIRLCRVMTKLFQSADKPELRTADARRDMANEMNNCLGRAVPHGRGRIVEHFSGDPRNPEPRR